MKKLLLATCVSSVLMAGNAYDYEISPVVGYAFPEHTQNLKDHGFLGLRIGKNLDLGFLSQVELGYDYSHKIKLRAKDGESLDYNKLKAHRFYLNGIKEFRLNDLLGVYGLLGAGYQHFTKHPSRVHDGGFGQAGLGMKFYVSDNMSLKLEARDLVDFHNGRNNLMTSLGFGYAFGGSKVASEPVVVEEAPKLAVEEVAVLDADGDGVPDNLDKCPNTPAGAVVDENGCQKVITLKLGLNFAFDSAKINPKYEEEIKEVSKVLNENPAYLVRLEGNTDSIGKASYNKKLSLRRALAVKNVLIKQGVDANRIKTVGLGEENPVASNATKEGRAQNRRVDAKFSK